MTERGVPLSAEKMRAKIDEAINACIENAQRLHEETYDLEFRSPPATRYYLLVIAQEEAAKAFLLYLIKEQIVSLTAAVRRAINDHTCKHLLGMIIDYMIMHWEELEELKAIIALDASLGADFPNDVGSAIEILRYEKIGRWTANNWSWAEDPHYDKGAVAIAGGKKDRRKQDAPYVRIGSNGQLASTPKTITGTEVSTELERTARYITFSEALIATEERHGFDRARFAKVTAALRLLFETAASRKP